SQGARSACSHALALALLRLALAQEFTMKQCHQCGGRIQENTGVQRVLRTGAFTGGGDYYRNVNLCDQCARDQSAAAQSSRVRRIVLMIVGVVAIAGALAYLWYYR